MPPVKPATDQNPARASTGKFAGLAELIRNHGKLLIVVVVILAVLGAAAYAWPKTQTPLPPEVLQAASTAVYYPTTLPAGYKLDTASPKASNGAVFYNLTDTASSSPIAITIQPLPSGFDANAALAYETVKKTAIPIGTAYEFVSQSHTTFMIVTHSDELLFIKSATKISEATMHSLLLNLKPINKD